MSYCTRKKVGCIIVRDTNILAYGWNGTPSGFDNCCEKGDVTLPIVLHAEQNALMKIASSHETAKGATLFVSMAPCPTCALLIIQAGIKEVFYFDVYRDTSGLETLNLANIKTTKI